MLFSDTWVDLCTWTSVLMRSLEQERTACFGTWMSTFMIFVLLRLATKRFISQPHHLHHVVVCLSNIIFFYSLREHSIMQFMSTISLLRKSKALLFVHDIFPNKFDKKIYPRKWLVAEKICPSKHAGRQKQGIWKELSIS